MPAGSASLAPSGVARPTSGAFVNVTTDKLIIRHRPGIFVQGLADTNAGVNAYSIPIMGMGIVGAAGLLLVCLPSAPCNRKILMTTQVL